MLVNVRFAVEKVPLMILSTALPAQKKAVRRGKIANSIEHRAGISTYLPSQRK
jgi:hypothetical protein